MAKERPGFFCLLRWVGRWCFLSNTVAELDICMGCLRAGVDRSMAATAWAAQLLDHRVFTRFGQCVPPPYRLRVRLAAVTESCAAVSSMWRRKLALWQRWLL